ncbi:MAG: NAD-dependent epimerase/dehydratase family protein [Phaeovulum sp.]|uniref:NAD-dependent epimerase/dehydratase family protein n=1 Tax=Phaeovulum sp. TaxID=2934796 RepID=UPI002730FA7B|nr:NAD-dependent epimerase/dehydratase family protein [Phaeovulum sp.]MDP2063892.1 NAD-dependent epimerase/dehydratase family protein [Phaeovulum sp.]
MRQLVVLFGGTGVIGSAAATVARQRGLDVLSISLDVPVNRRFYRNLQLDLESVSPPTLAKTLDEAVGGSPVALLFDIIGLGGKTATAMAEIAAARAAPVALISSCLLYDQDGSGPVDENCPLVTDGPDCHAYLRDKLAVEAFWRNEPRVGWRIFRCHHILGAGSNLGCIPNHNRDPQLLARLRRGEPLALARGGELSLSWIHPEDLAAAVLDLCADPRSRHASVNLSAPDPVRAQSYYEAIARALELPAPEIRHFDPDPGDFWALTARDNVFVSGHPFFNELSFRHDFASAIRDALAVPENERARRARFMLARIAGRMGG